MCLSTASADKEGAGLGDRHGGGRPVGHECAGAVEIAGQQLCTGTREMEGRTGSRWVGEAPTRACEFQLFRQAVERIEARNFGNIQGKCLSLSLPELST